MSTLPLNIAFASLPPNVAWTPQQLGDAIAERLYITTQQTFALFVSGSTEPSSNVGPWLKNGETWYVWSDADGGYVAQTIEPASLGYWIGPDAPDNSVYNFWIETAAGGSPLALKIYYSSAWTDVYATELASYLTIVAAAATYQTIAGMSVYSTTVQMDAAIAAALVPYLTSVTAAATYLTIANAASTYAPLASPTFTDTPAAPTAAPGTNTTQIATTAFVTAAIAAIAPPASFTSAPAKAVLAGTQTVAIDTNPYKLLFASEVFDPNNVYEAANSRYLAPATGYYQVFAELQVDNNGGAAAAMEIELHVYVNGAAVATIGCAVASPPGSRWYPQISTLVQATSGQTIEIYMEATDGVNAANLDVSVASAFSINRVPQS
jgi:hypothetical protein